MMDKKPATEDTENDHRGHRVLCKVPKHYGKNFSVNSVINLRVLCGEKIWGLK